MKNVLVDRLAQHIKNSFVAEIQNGNPENMDTLDMVQRMRLFRNDFASGVAITVCESHSISEKQAVCLAKGIVQNSENFADYLRLCPSDCFAIDEGEYVSE